MTPRCFEEAGAEVGVDDAGAAVATLEDVTRVLEPPEFSVMTEMSVDILGLFDVTDEATEDVPSLPLLLPPAPPPPLPPLALVVPVLRVIERRVGEALAEDEDEDEDEDENALEEEPVDEVVDEDVGAAGEEVDDAGLVD